eukprot:scaffold8005_cov118-Isochrysis_galbana.AAC.16
MGEPSRYPEIRMARFLYAMQWLPPDLRADYDLRQQWIMDRQQHVLPRRARSRAPPNCCNWQLANWPALWRQSPPQIAVAVQWFAPRSSKRISSKIALKVQRFVKQISGDRVIALEVQPPPATDTAGRPWYRWERCGRGPTRRATATIASVSKDP